MEVTKHKNRRSNRQVQESINKAPIPDVKRIQHQTDPTFFSGPTTQEDYYWGWNGGGGD